MIDAMYNYRQGEIHSAEFSDAFNKLCIPFEDSLSEEHRGVQIPMFAVLTRESVEPVSSIHDRMPLILGKDSLREWVRPDSDPGRIAKKALTNMVMEKAIDYPEPKPGFMQI